MKGVSFGLLVLILSMAASEAYAAPKEQDSHAGKVIFECTVTARYQLEACTIVSDDVGILVEYGPILKYIEADGGAVQIWRGKRPQPGARVRLTVCDETPATEQAIASGLECAMYEPDSTSPTQTATPSQEEIAEELNRRAPSPPKGTYPQVELVAFPSSIAMAEAYPLVALDANINAGVRLRCHWVDDGSFDRCEVMAEYPEGMGFGDATVRIILAHGRIAPVPDVPDEKRWKWLTYNWLLQ